MLTSTRQPWVVITMTESDAKELKSALERAITLLDGQAQYEAEDGMDVGARMADISELRHLANNLHTYD